MSFEGSADLRFNTRVSVPHARAASCIVPGTLDHALDRSAMHQSSTLSIAMEVHQEASTVAYVAKAHNADVVDLATIGTRHVDIEHLIRTLLSHGERCRQGSRPTAGHPQARRVLVEGAWADRLPWMIVPAL